MGGLHGGGGSTGQNRLHGLKKLKIGPRSLTLAPAAAYIISNSNQVSNDVPGACAEARPRAGKS